MHSHQVRIPGKSASIVRLLAANVNQCAVYSFYGFRCGKGKCKMKDLFDGCFFFCICIAIHVLLVADCKCQIVLFIISLLSNVVKVNHWWIQVAFRPWPYPKA